MENILNELVNIEHACARAFNQKNIPKILDYFDADISGFSSTAHDRFHGKDELQKTFEYYISEAEEVTFDIMEPELALFGEFAVLSFYWKVTLKSGAKETEIPGRGTHVYQRKNGKWKIVHEHFSRAH